MKARPDLTPLKYNNLWEVSDWKTKTIKKTHLY